MVIVSSEPIVDKRAFSHACQGKAVKSLMRVIGDRERLIGLNSFIQSLVHRKIEIERAGHWTKTDFNGCCFLIKFKGHRSGFLISQSHRRSLIPSSSLDERRRRRRRRRRRWTTKNLGKKEKRRLKVKKAIFCFFVFSIKALSSIFSLFRLVLSRQFFAETNR